MSKTTIIVTVVVIILIAAGVVVDVTHTSSNQVSVAPSSTVPSDATLATTSVTTSAPVIQPGGPMIPATLPAQSFTINANDESADLTTITVPKGTPVSITFNVSASGTYHGGLDFKSSVIDSGTVPPGTSKTITFTANSSFLFIPYWPASNVRKPYTISVVVN